MTSLKLVALDEEDLEILSAHLQDALLRTEDIAWQPGSRRFVALLNRFDWEKAVIGETRGKRPGSHGLRHRHRRWAGLDASRQRGRARCSPHAQWM